jgi:transposase InsO family protein
MTQGEIEHYHRSLKSRILLENYYLPGQLEARLAEFVDFHNTRRYHESLGNLTRADIYFGRGPAILARRQNYQTQDHRITTAAASAGRRLNLNLMAQPSLVSKRSLSQMF